MVGKAGARIGTAAFALGLSLAGPQSTGLATADDGSGESSTVSAGPAGEATPAATSASRCAMLEPLSAWPAAAAAAVELMVGCEPDLYMRIVKGCVRAVCCTMKS